MHLGRLIEPSMLVCVMIMNENDYDQSPCLVCMQTGLNHTKFTDH